SPQVKTTLSELLPDTATPVRAVSPVIIMFMVFANAILAATIARHYWGVTYRNKSKEYRRLMYTFGALACANMLEGVFLIARLSSVRLEKIVLESTLI